MEDAQVRIGVDVGGTNTDAVLIDGLRIVASSKQPTTADVSGGVAADIRALHADGATAPGAVAAVMNGHTQFTNAPNDRRSHSRDGIKAGTARGRERV